MRIFRVGVSLSQTESDISAGVTEENGGDVERRMEHLRRELRRHSHLYHVESRPEIDDSAYDRMFAIYSSRSWMVHPSSSSTNKDSSYAQ